MNAIGRQPSRDRAVLSETAFDHEECLYEVNLDGFRALAHVTGDRCQLVSRNGHVFKSWPQLAVEIADVVRCKSVVLDGEICCLGSDGRTRFNDLLFHRARPHFYAFDVLAIDGEDLTGLTLLERKRRLRSIMPTIGCRLLHLDWVVGRGTDLYRLACKQDLEGIVAKWRHGTYQCDGRTTSWIKIKNPAYSQAEGRPELFEARRERRHTTARRTIAPEPRFATTYRFLLDVNRSGTIGPRCPEVDRTPSQGSDNQGVDPDLEHLCSVRSATGHKAVLPNVPISDYSEGDNRDRGDADHMSDRESDHNMQ